MSKAKTQYSGNRNRGILHTEQRMPVETRTNSSGGSEDVHDPRGYWLGQRTNPKRNAERRLAAQMGHRQHRMLVKRTRAADKLAQRTLADDAEIVAAELAQAAAKIDRT